jgi:hypothetical protein
VNRFFVLIAKILTLFCHHRWAYVQRVNLGIGVFAKFTCQKCRKSAYVPYSGGDDFTKYDSGLL